MTSSNGLKEALVREWWRHCINRGKIDDRKIGWQKEIEQMTVWECVDMGVKNPRGGVELALCRLISKYITYNGFAQLICRVTGAKRTFRWCTSETGARYKVAVLVFQSHQWHRSKEFTTT